MMHLNTGLRHRKGIKHLQITPEPAVHKSVFRTARAMPHKVGNLVRAAASHRAAKLTRLRQKRKAEVIHLRHVPTAGVTQHPAGVIPPLPGHPGVFHHQAVVQVDHQVVAVVVQVVRPAVEAVVAEGKLNL